MWELEKKSDGPAELEFMALFTIVICMFLIWYFEFSYIQCDSDHKSSISMRIFD